MSDASNLVHLGLAAGHRPPVSDSLAWSIAPDHDLLIGSCRLSVLQYREAVARVRMTELQMRANLIRCSAGIVPPRALAPRKPRVTTAAPS